MRSRRNCGALMNLSFPTGKVDMVHITAVRRHGLSVSSEAVAGNRMGFGVIHVLAYMIP